MITRIVVSKAADVPLQAVDGGKPTLVYWNILGLAQSLRLALVAAGVDFVDVCIDAVPEAWFGAKSKLAEVCAMPNLPYYMDSKVTLVQSDAIMRYIGRTYGLMGDEGQEHLVDMALDELKDIESRLATFSYGHGTEAVTNWFKSSMPKSLDNLKRFLGDKAFVTGSKLSIADAKLYTVISKLSIIQEMIGTPETAAVLAEWAPYLKRVESIPAIQEYVSGPNLMTRPLNNPIAKFNN